MSRRSNKRRRPRRPGISVETWFMVIVAFLAGLLALAIVIGLLKR